MDQIAHDLASQLVYLLVFPLIYLVVRQLIQYGLKQYQQLPAAEQALLSHAASRMVAAAEQIFSNPESGPQKKAWVYHQLHCLAQYYGIDISEGDLNLAIEAAVFLVINAGKDATLTAHVDHPVGYAQEERRPVPGVRPDRPIGDEPAYPTPPPPIA